MPLDVFINDLPITILERSDDNGQYYLWDLNNTKCFNGFYFEFRQSFAKETFSNDELLKSQNIQY